MRCTLLRFLCLCAFVVSPALPDIVDVNVNGSVSGSGGLYVDVGGNPLPGCVNFNGGPYICFSDYSFSGTNTQIGAL